MDLAIEKEIWDKFIKTGEGRDDLIQRYLPLIKYVVGRMAIKIGRASCRERV